MQDLTREVPTAPGPIGRVHPTFEHAPFAVQTFGPDGTARSANGAWCRLWDAEPGALEGYRLLHDPALRAAGVAGRLERAFRGESVTIGPHRYDPGEAGRPGRPRWVEAAAFPVFDEAGAVREVVVVLRDATGRESEGQVLPALEAGGLGTWRVDLRTDTATLDAPEAALLGFPPEPRVVSMAEFFACTHPDDRDRVAAENAEARERGATYHTEFRVVHPDGAVRWLTAAGRFVRGADGEVAAVVGVNADVTPLKEAVHALEGRTRTLGARARERDARVRALSLALAEAEEAERRRIARVLHDDLQQTLAGAMVLAETGQTGRLLAALERASHAARTLSHELAPPHLDDGDDLGPLFEWLAERERSLHGLDVTVDVQGRVEVADRGTRSLVYHLVRELLFNVVKHAGTDRARLAAAPTPGGVRVVVEDEGAGFDASAGAGPACGLGLRSVRDRVELVGGRLTVESAPSEGTRVTLDVPDPLPDGAESA